MTAKRPAGWIAPGPRPRGGDAPGPDEELSYLSGDWQIFQRRGGHKWSLDDLVTAWIATRDLRDGIRALDLGCGLGSVLMLVAWKLPHADVTGVEAQADRAALGRRSLRFNGADDRCRIVDGDLRDGVPPGPYDLVTGTPPYFPRGTGTESDKPHAMPCRFELRGGVEDYLAAARRVIAPGGRIVVVTSALERERVVGDRLEHWEIITKAGKPPLICVDVFADGPRRDHELTVRDRDGQWTPAFRAVRDAMGMPSQPAR